MHIDNVKVGLLQTNCYIVTLNNKTIIIDPGDEANKIIAACEGKNVVGVLITHHHYDHVGALKEIEDYYKIKESLSITGFDFEILKTPGHTDDSLSFYFKNEKVLFSGDFLFKETFGRTDLPTGSNAKMMESLKTISCYPDDLKVYPGHDESTILGLEKTYFEAYYEFLKNDQNKNY